MIPGRGPAKWCLSLIMLGLAAGSVACGGTTTGRPEADVPSPASAGASLAAPAGALPVDRVCSLLSAADLTQLGVSATPREDMTGTAHTCELTAATYGITLAVWSDAGLSHFRAANGTVTSLRIGRHDADRELDDTGACTIGIGVTDSSRVDVVADAFDGSNPCAETLRVARLVEPKLP